MGRDRTGLFVGRDRELELLNDGLREASTGLGGLFLIAGEPGIGKSRLAEQFAAAAQSAGATVLWGRCWEAGGAPPFWPWVDCLRAHLRDVDPGTLRDQLGGSAPYVAQILPDISLLLGDVPEPAVLGDLEAARFRLFDATATFLRNVAADRLLVLVLEDLHGADTPSLILLEFVARELSDMRVLVVATYRDVEVGPAHPLARTLGEVDRLPTTRRLQLVGLSPSEVGVLITSVADVTPSDALVDAVARETDGNPLFAGEIVRLLVAEGRLSSIATVSGRPLPQGVRAVISRRLEHVSERCRHVLGIAGVLGREFPLDVLSEISERGREELLEIFDEAIQARLVSGVPVAVGSMQFSHSLIRDALYEDVGAARRARLHRRAGEALERLRADATDHLAELAHHFFASAPLGDAPKARQYAIRAAQRASAGLAFEEAARLYEMALRAMDLEEEPDIEHRFDVLAALGDALSRSGNAEAARAAFLAAAALARLRADPDGLARAALGYGGRFTWTVLRGDAHLVPLLEEALDSLGNSSTPARVMLMGRLAAGPLRDDADATRRKMLSASALDLARRLGDPVTVAYALEARLSAVMAPDERGEMLELSQELEGIGLRTGDGELQHHVHMMRLAVRLFEGDMPAIAHERGEIARLSEQLRQGPQIWFALTIDAQLALLAGRFDEAERLTEAAYEAGRRAEPYALFAHRLQMFWTRAAQGRLGEIEPLFRASIPQFSRYPLWRSVLPYLLLCFGCADEARDALADALAHPRPVNEEWLLAEAALADAIASLKDRRAAAVLYSELAPYAELTMGGIPNVNLGSIQRPLGRLACLLERREDAEHHFQAAIRRNDEMRARPWAAQARYDYATMLLGGDRPGDREQAHWLTAAALTVAHDLSMRDLERQLELVDAPQPPLKASLDAGPTVFRREGEYWTVIFGADAFRLRDSKGMRYLAHLLQRPHDELHVLDLTRLESPPPRGASATAQPQDSVDAWLSDLGPAVDGQAKASYQARLRDLDEDLDEASAGSDLERARRIQVERDFLIGQIAAAVGLHGRDRKIGSPAERCRVNVTRSIKSALGRIRAHSPDLARHLDATIHTGAFCSYGPDPRAPVAWQMAEQGSAH